MVNTMRISLLSLLVLAAVARAELPSPRLDRIFPSVPSAGSSVEVEVAGADLDGPKALTLRPSGHQGGADQGPQIQGERRRQRARGDLRRSRGRQVGRQQPATVYRFARTERSFEKEPNDEPATAQAVAMNSAVHGTTDNNKDDIFKFSAKKGQRIVIDCQAGKLDSMLDATMTLTAPTASCSPRTATTTAATRSIDFVAPGRRRLLRQSPRSLLSRRVPYRLVVTDRPQVDHVFPRAVQAGKPQTVTIYGRNLGPGSKPSAWRVGDLALEEKEETSLPRPTCSPTALYRFTDHPTTHSVLPTAATATLTGFQVTACRCSSRPRR